jgi:hypothetical protein
MATFITNIVFRYFIILTFFTVNTEAAATVAKETLENVETTVNLERQISEDFVAAKESKKAATIAAIKRNQEVLELKVIWVIEF